MAQQSPTISLIELKNFLQQISTQQTDPYWQTILQSDIRNILPKHEVCKIELVKNSLSKTRLIMENLNTFISLEVQKKHLKDEMIDLNSNISQELQEIVNQQKEPKIPNHYHYDISLNKRKKQLQVIAKELSRSKTSNELKILIQKSKKWQHYIEKNLKQLQMTRQEDMHEDIANFIETYQGLFMLGGNGQSGNGQSIHSPCKQTLQQVILKSGAYTKLYQNKLKDRILIAKLLDDIYGQRDQAETSDQDDYWRQQVAQIRKLNDI